jgi:hypothetical protein
MLFAVPDSFVCPQPDDNNLHGCNPSNTNDTSLDNRYYNNVMGTAPDGTYMPNGVDFWWDNFPGNTGDCWYNNKAFTGKSIVTSPSTLPDCSGGKDPSTSVGTGDAANEQELLGCAGSVEGGTDTCPWYSEPPKPSRR